MMLVGVHLSSLWTHSDAAREWGLVHRVVVCLCRTLRAERSANSKAKFSRRQRNCKSRELSALLVLALALLLISRNLPTPFYHLVSGLSCQVILDSCDKFAICAGPFQLTFKDTWIRHKDTHLPISLMPFLQIQKQYLQPIQQTLGGNGPSIFHFCICLLRKLEKFGWPPKKEEKRFFFWGLFAFPLLGKRTAADTIFSFNHSFRWAEE